MTVKNKLSRWYTDIFMPIQSGLWSWFHSSTISIVTKNLKRWKYKLNGQFLAYVENQLYQNPFFSTVHQNINKSIGWAIKAVSKLPFLLPMRLISEFFFLLSRYKHARIKLRQKMLHLFKETHQHHIKHRMEGQTSRSLNSFSLFCQELPLK